MALAELKADAKLLRERLTKLNPSQLDVKHELTENIVPLFEGLIEALQEGLEADVSDIGEAVDELIDQSGDVLHPETSQKVLAVLEVGQLLANELEAVMAKLDDMAKKRVKQTIKAYRQGVEVLTEIVTEITMPLDDEEDEEDEEAPAEGESPDEDDDDGKIIAAADGEG